MRHARLFYEFFRQAWGDENNPLSYRARPEIRTTEEEAIQQLRQLIEKIEADGDLDPDIKRLYFLKKLIFDDKGSIVIK